MQTYYALGYTCALQKLGMVEKDALAEQAIALAKGLGGAVRKGAKGVAGAVRRDPVGLPQIEKGEATARNALVKRTLSEGQAKEQATRQSQRAAAPAAKPGAPKQKAQLPAPAEAEMAARYMEGTGPKAFGQALPQGLKPAPATSLEGVVPKGKPAAGPAPMPPPIPQQGLLSRVSPVTGPMEAAPATAGGKTKTPTVESKTQPAVKAPPTEKSKTKEVPQGFLSKYKWPLLGGAGLAGLGGYAYMKNRDPMGGYPVQGY